MWPGDNKEGAGESRLAVARSLSIGHYASGARAKRRESERFRRFAYADLVGRDKVNLDIFWLKDDTLDDPDLLPAPEEVAAEIVENLEAALERFRRVAGALNRP